MLLEPARRRRVMSAVMSAVIALGLSACVDDAPPAEDPPPPTPRMDARPQLIDAALPDAELEADAEVPDAEVPDVGCVPGREICDGIDDDCDGTADEEADGQGAPCAFELPGICGLGRQICAGGRLTCVQANSPGPETCDEADNDCDGLVDEGLGGEACETGEPGVCARGSRQCVAGAFRCVPGTQPAPEACDGLDNDCDGAPDEDDGAGAECVGCIDDVPDVVLQPVCGQGGPANQLGVGGCAEDRELHIFGHYEPTGARTAVRITRVAAPMAIVLSSYESTTWSLELAEGVLLERVIINGYEPSVVEGVPEGVIVDDRTGVGNYLVACAYDWPAGDGGCETPELVRAAEAVLGLELTSFQGCYSGTSFGLATEGR